MMQINGSGLLAELCERDIGALQAISGPPRGTDIARPAQLVRFVPTPEMRRRAEAPTSSLLQRLNLTGPPSFVEPRLERAVEAKERVPSFAGDGLHPVVLLAGGRLGPEIDVH